MTKSIELVLTGCHVSLARASLSIDIEASLASAVFVEAPSTRHITYCSSSSGASTSICERITAAKQISNGEKEENEGRKEVPVAVK
jgi:hypothetical protein